MGARDQKFDRISLFHVILVISGIILNVVLANITGSMGLPIFLDSIGTILVAWQCGMISGVLTALVSSFICGLFSPLSIYYSLVNIMMALLTSGFSFKGILEKRIGKLYLILGLTAVGGLFGSIIEWLLNGEPDRFYMIKMTENFSNNMRISVFSAFLLLSIFFNFIDKVITVLIAWGVSTFIPKYVSETIWYRTLQKDYKISEDDSFRDDESYKKRRKIRVKLLVILAAEAILLTIIIAWVSVSIYMDFTRRDRIEVANGQAKSVAGIVDGDYIDDYIEERGQSEEYELTNQILSDMRDNSSISEEIFVYQYDENGYKVVFDIPPEGVEKRPVGTRGEYDKYTIDYKDEFCLGEDIKPIDYKSPKNWDITVYKPVYDSNGICKAYIGVVISLDNMRVYLFSFVFKILLISSGFLIMSLALGLWLSANYHNIMDYQFQKTRMAQIEADRANLAKSRFIANMSHEIRTPINTIMGMDEMILRERTDGVPKEYALTVNRYASDIKKASTLLLGIINDILDVSKIESGKMKIVEQSYQIEDLLHSLVSMTKMRSKGANLNFEVEIDEKLPKVMYGDESKIKQVLLNLLSNAVKYTEKGGFSLKVLRLDSSNEICRIYFAVEDTGVGVKKENIEKLFSAFERLDEKRNSAIQGTGLGLNISKQFVSLMGGDLKCESEYGKGSIFFFELNQRIIDNTPIGYFDQDKIVIDETEYKPRFYAPKAKVLVVDDNEMNLMVIKGLLRDTGCELTLVTSGRECIDKIKDYDFDLVLLDHMMPEMDGLQTLNEIRKIAPGMVVIALTANAAENGREFYRGVGFQDYLAKPVQGINLEEMIQKYLPSELLEMHPDDVKMNRFAEETREESDEVDSRLPKKMEWLKEIEGINLVDCLNFCGDADLLLNFLKTFYETIDENSDVLSEALKNEDYKLYTIKVHALKSTSRIIGAYELSELAKSLEAAGNELDVNYIKENTPKLLSLYATYKDKLKKVDDSEKLNEAHTESVGDEEMHQAYLALKEYVPQMDYDTIQVILEQIQTYKLSEKEEKFFKEFDKNLQIFAWDTLEDMIDEVLKEYD